MRAPSSVVCPVRTARNNSRICAAWRASLMSFAAFAIRSRRTGFLLAPAGSKEPRQSASSVHVNSNRTTGKHYLKQRRAAGTKLPRAQMPPPGVASRANTTVGSTIRRGEKSPMVAYPVDGCPVPRLLTIPPAISPACSGAFSVVARLPWRQRRSRAASSSFGLLPPSQAGLLRRNSRFGCEGWKLLRRSRLASLTMTELQPRLA